MDKLEQFFNCSDCGHEGFLEDFEKDSGCEGCSSIAKR